MLSHNSIAKAGDCVLLYESPKSSTCIVLIQKEIYQNKYGIFYHDDIIGTSFGSKIYSRSKKNEKKDFTSWLLLLSPTPEQWSLSLKHRTQIMYPTDISVVLSQLYIKPGSVVYESGTGSGSLSCSFIRSIAPYGYLHTFEFNEHRVKEARADFDKFGLTDYVTVYWRDICGNGFPTCDTGVDAIFLDLPSPYELPVITSITKCLKPFGRLCSFSPCMEQVSKMCVEMARHEFQEIVVLECLQRSFTVHNHEFNIADYGQSNEEKRDVPVQTVAYQTQVQRGHTGYLTFATYRPKTQTDVIPAIEITESKMEIN